MTFVQNLLALLVHLAAMLWWIAALGATLLVLVASLTDAVHIDTRIYVGREEADLGREASIVTTAYVQQRSAHPKQVVAITHTPAKD